MDLVYIVGSGSKWGDNELRYSLRSVQAFGENVDQVFIIGNHPHWLRNTVHSNYGDPFDRKCDNAWFKIKRFCRDRRTPFILMNDDFFLLQKTDFNNLPMFYDGNIEELIGRYETKTDYVDLMQQTIKYLQQNGKPTVNYALHYPITIEPEKMKAFMNTMGPRPGMSFRNVYGNFIEAENKQRMADLKINHKLTSTEFVHTRQFFSIGDKFLDEAGKTFLETLYPLKSKWEA